MSEALTRRPHTDVLAAAHRLAAHFLDTVESRHVGDTATRGALLDALGGPLPIDPANPLDVIEHLASGADAGIVATAGPRYFGFVTGGAVPVTVAADWLASGWDQNAILHVHAPAITVMEEIVAGWLLELLDLPRASGVGFASGCHLANFTCLAAARHEILRRCGWNVEAQGLRRAPDLRVIVGDEIHTSAVGALRFLGFGSDELERVPVDRQGRMMPEHLRAVLGRRRAPAIVCAQVGNVNTGASDPIDEIVAIAHAENAWVHVDGAFGLWAAAVPELRRQIAGIEKADSWATDAHKWLNVPYDSGLAIVANAAPHRAAMSFSASYLPRGDDQERAGMDWVPESSRRARVVPLYALIRTLGQLGITAMIRRNCRLAARMATRLSEQPGVAILNDVVLNQVLVQFAGADDRAADVTTRDVIARVQAEGTCWAGGTVWQGRQAMRVSISNWSTTETDIDRSAAAILGCYRQAIERAV